MKLRVALVGCGAISPIHVRGILAAGQEICALCDLDTSRAKALCVRFELAQTKIYSDLESLLDAEMPDILHICTPHYLHAEMCIAALKRNVHVLCEKPLCISYEQLAALRLAAESSRATLGVCHQNRYESNFFHIHEAASGGVSGACGSVVWNRDAAYYNSAAWRGTWAQEGGGVMINQALHTLDLLQWICGMPETVIAHTVTDTHKSVMETEDTAAARFETANGTVFHMFATVNAKVNFPAEIRVGLASGEILAADIGLLTQNGQILTPANTERLAPGKTEWGSGHAALIKDFYRCVDQKLPFPIDLEEGAKVVRLILAMYRSNGSLLAID